MFQEENFFLLCMWWMSFGLPCSTRWLAFSNAFNRNSLILSLYSTECSSLTVLKKCYHLSFDGTRFSLPQRVYHLTSLYCTLHTIQPFSIAQETPKLDGLACNFVLGTPDKLKYPLLLDALLSLLGAAGVCDRWPAPPLPALCAAHYCFQSAWRWDHTIFNFF